MSPVSCLIFCTAKYIWHLKFLCYVMLCYGMLLFASRTPTLPQTRLNHAIEVERNTLLSTFGSRPSFEFWWISCTAPFNLVSKQTSFAVQTFFFIISRCEEGDLVRFIHAHGIVLCRYCGSSTRFRTLKNYADLYLLQGNAFPESSFSNASFLCQ